MKRNKEVIDIILSGEPKRGKSQLELAELYHEMKAIKKEEDPYLDYTLDQKNKKINEFIIEFPLSLESFLNRLYTLLLFQEGIKKDLKFKINLEKVNDASLIFKDACKTLSEAYSDVDKAKEDAVDQIFNQLRIYEKKFKEASEILSYLYDTYFRNIKMTSLAAIKDKKSYELEGLAREVNALIKSYSNLEHAYYDIYYYSGDLIVKTVKALVSCLEKGKNKSYALTYNYSYFLKSDAILNFELKEWINLFNKFKFIMKTTSNVELYDYLQFSELYQKLEKRYFVVLIFYEFGGGR
ncbi:MAG TPA: hypothetical protein PLE44_03480 [Bacilli bacterium]|nr:hypothetical protein [Bacilli bacterium]HOR53281.1 hypothetical protein [Bacilli bacterium]